jgi:hypothetical protein
MTEPISDENGALLFDLCKGLDFSPILDRIYSSKTYTIVSGFSKSSKPCGKSSKNKNKTHFIKTKLT